MSNPTATLGLTKPRYGTEPIIAKDLDLIDAAIAADRVSIAGLSGGGGPHFLAVTLDASLLTNISADNSGGQRLIAAVAGKIIVPVSVVAKYHYGGAAFTGVAFNDLAITPQTGISGFPETMLIGSSQAWLDQTHDLWQVFAPYGANAGSRFDSSGGGDLFLCNQAGEMGGGAGSTVKFYIQYLLFDIAGEVFN